MMLANSLSGKVIDQNSKVAMPYVTVSLLSTDSILLTGTITDEKGLFTIDVQKNASILCLTYKFGTYQEHKWRKVGDSDDSRSGEGGGRGK